MNNYKSAIKTVFSVSLSTLLIGSCLLLQACSGGGSGNGPSPDDPHKPTTIHLVDSLPNANGTNIKIKVFPGNTPSPDLMECFKSTKILENQGASLDLNVVKNCSAYISIDSEQMLDPFIVDQDGHITSPDGVLGKVYAKISDDRKTITFEEKPPADHGILTISNRVHPSSGDPGDPSIVITSLGKTSCFIDGEQSVTVTNIGQPGILHFTQQAQHGTCQANIKFGNTPTTCLVNFDNANMRDPDAITKHCTKGYTTWSTEFLPNVQTSSSNDKTTSTTSLTFANETYPFKTLQWQADSWLSQIDENGLVSGGINGGTYTSEGIGFLMLIDAGMINLSESKGNSKDLKMYTYEFMTAYKFVKNNLNGATTGGNPGLLPWEFKVSAQGRAISVEDPADALDGNFFIAEAEYVAGTKLLDSDMVDNAKKMMQAMYKYDVTTQNSSYTYLNCGGTDAWKPGVTPPYEAAYTKSFLAFMAQWAQWDSADNWALLIKHTLDIMQATQNDVSNTARAGDWHGILGFIAQNSGSSTPGAIVIKTTLPLTTDLDKNGKGDWFLNYDAIRVPMILGSFIMTPPDVTYPGIQDDKQEATEILQKEMGAIDRNYWDNGHYGKAMGGGGQLSIFDAGTLTPPSPGEYTDDAVAGNYMIGQAGLAAGGVLTQDPQRKILEDRNINQSFGCASYYDPFWKILGGLFMANAFDVDTTTILGQPLTITSTNIPTDAMKELPILPQGLDGSNTAYYQAVYFGPGFYNSAGWKQKYGKQNMKLRLTIHGITLDKGVTWKSGNWGQDAVTVEGPDTQSPYISTWTITPKGTVNMGNFGAFSINNKENNLKASDITFSDDG